MVVEEDEAVGVACDDRAEDFPWVSAGFIYGADGDYGGAGVFQA